MEKNIMQDVTEFASTFPLSSHLQDATILITGATGLIGSSLIHCLLALGKDIKIIAPVRNSNKAKNIFNENIENIKLIECDLLMYDYSEIGPVDYIIHCAAPTGSKFFVEHAVETFEVVFNGTQRLLAYARKYCKKGFVYLSSLEVYGSVNDDTLPINESFQGFINPLDLRSSYPMAKRAAETLCYLYAKQYGLRIMIARLTQTTGAGVSKEDNRVIVQFARLAAQGKNIVLHTKGDSARPYCYISDAVSGILYVMLKGETGEAYNVSADNTYISAKGIADFLHEKFAPNINVLIELKDNMGYAPATKQRLDSSKLQQLGWFPRYDLEAILKRLIDYLKNEK